MIISAIAGEFINGLILIIIQCLTGGVFIYLACCDLLIHEFHNAKFVSKLDNFKKFVAMCFGSSVVLILIAFAPAHSH